jgi:hypothetical protein
MEILSWIFPSLSTELWDVQCMYNGGTRILITVQVERSREPLLSSPLDSTLGFWGFSLGSLEWGSAGAVEVNHAFMVLGNKWYDRSRRVAYWLGSIDWLSPNLVNSNCWDAGLYLFARSKQAIRYSQSRPSNVRVTGSTGSPFSRLAICEINFVCLVGSRPSDQDQSQDYNNRYVPRPAFSRKGNGPREELPIVILLKLKN